MPRNAANCAMLTGHSIAPCVAWYFSAKGTARIVGTSSSTIEKTRVFPRHTCHANTRRVNGETATKYGIMGIRTSLLFEKGAVAKQMGGAMPKTELVQELGLG